MSIGPSIYGLAGMHGRQGAASPAAVGAFSDLADIPVIVPLVGIGVGLAVHYVVQRVKARKQSPLLSPSSLEEVALTSEDESPTGTVRTGHLPQLRDFTPSEFGGGGNSPATVARGDYGPDKGRPSMVPYSVSSDALTRKRL